MNESSTLKHHYILFSTFAHRCHLVRAVIGFAALLSTFGYVLLFARHRPLRNKLNYAICNLLLSNGLLASVIAVFSTLKSLNADSLNELHSCISFTWVITFLSFGPSWSVGLMALVRAVQFSNSDHLDAFLSLRLLVFFRIVMALLDCIVTSAVLYDKAALVTSTQCTYQLMLEESVVYTVYTLLIIIFLVAAGVAAIVLRFRLRRQLLAQVKGTCSGSADSAQQLVNNISQSVPINLFKKPMLMLLACLLVVLFTLPRTAFFVGSNELWQLSTLCPVIIALILPPSFVYYVKDCRVAFANDIRRFLAA